MILSRNDLQVIACDVLRDYSSKVRLSATSRIDPTDVARRSFGLKIAHRKLSQDGNTLGMTSMSPVEVSVWNGKVKEMYYLDGHDILIDSILFQESYQSGRYNYTVAHELGHQIMYTLFPYEYDPIALRRLTAVQLRSLRPFQQLQAA